MLVIVGTSLGLHFPTSMLHGMIAMVVNGAIDVCVASEILLRVMDYLKFPDSAVYK